MHERDPASTSDVWGVRALVHDVDTPSDATIRSSVLVRCRRPGDPNGTSKAVRTYTAGGDTSEAQPTRRLLGDGPVKIRITNAATTRTHSEHAMREVHNRD